MQIFYFFSSYISHQIAALGYTECLRELGHTVYTNLPLPEKTQAQTGQDCFCPGQTSFKSVQSLENEQIQAYVRKADIIILHEDPLWFEDIFRYLSVAPHQKVISYLPWENARLSPAFIEPLQRVNAIWTCSEFSRGAFAEHFANVHVLPHIIKRVPPVQEDMRWAAEFLQSQGVKLGQGASSGLSLNKAQCGLAEGDSLFFSIVDAVNPRKNVQGLLHAFARSKERSKGNTHLLLKESRVNVPYDSLPGVITLSERISAGQIAALHMYSTAYVSAHRLEGWGLGLSEAMAFGKPVIATGYSGNMEFMTEQNSLPQPYRLEPVSSELVQLIPLFTPDMFWAEVDVAAMARAMQQVAQGRVPQGLSAAAFATAKKFSKSNIKARLATLLSN